MGDVSKARGSNSPVERRKLIAHLAHREARRYRFTMESHTSSSNIERRNARRAPLRLFCNQYIDGSPCLSEAVELSMTGALIRRVLGPSHDRASYALEIGGVTGHEGRVWVCATPVWRLGNYEAVRFIAQSETDRLRLADLIHSAAPHC